MEEPNDAAVEMIWQVIGMVLLLEKCQGMKQYNAQITLNKGCRMGETWELSATVRF
jgi:hypothetical protein